VSRAYTCWHTFMGGTLTSSFHHEPRRVPGGRWVAQRVRRLASVWLGSNIQSSLEVTRVRSELGCHSHRFSRRPRQSSRALVHCHQTPCCSQLCTLWHRTHTQYGRDMHHCQGVGVRSFQNHHQSSLDAISAAANVHDARLPIHEVLVQTCSCSCEGSSCQWWC
jgi:hypothetical protein